MTEVCVGLWFVCGVGPGFDSTSPAFMMRRTATAGSPQKNGIAPHSSGGRDYVDTIFMSVSFLTYQSASSPTPPRSPLPCICMIRIRFGCRLRCVSHFEA